MRKKLRWGILGTASIARWKTVSGMLAANNCELFAIAGRNPDKVDAFRREFGIPVGYNSYEELLNDPDIDAVYIPLPIQLHKEWTIASARHGKHILCEKPLAPSEADAAEMFACCEENGVKLMEAIPYLHSPLITRIKEIQKSGEIGEIISVASTFLTMPHSADNIRIRRETYGGALYDMGCYNTSLALTIMEMDPESVSVACSKTPEGIDDTSAVVLDFGTRYHKRALSIQGMCLGARQMDIRFLISGTKGNIAVNERAFNDSGELSFSITEDACKRIESIILPNPYMQEVENFGKSILDDMPLVVTMQHSLSNARLLDRILADMDYGKA